VIFKSQGMILITGHKGFIGQNLVDKMLNSSYSLNDLVLIDLKEGDVFKSLEDVDFGNIKKVIHLGAISDTTETDIKKMMNFNVTFTLELFKKAQEFNIPVIYASSASVYGNTNDYSYNPLNLYADLKMLIDTYVESHIDKFVHIVGLRFFNVYGKKEEHKKSQASPVTQFSIQAKTIGIINVFEGSANYKRDFVSVDDVIECIFLSDMKKSGIYDVGTSTQSSFLDVANIIAERYNCAINEIEFPEKLKDKYQYNTLARNHFDKRFLTIKQWLKLNM
jgi:ADP-L-glycero-D-manno-heptose 6-epimerase